MIVQDRRRRDLDDGGASPRVRAHGLGDIVGRSWRTLQALPVGRRRNRRRAGRADGRSRAGGGARGRARRGRRLLVAGVMAAVLVLLGGGWLWLRDSPLVAVQRVDVTGLTGADAAQINAVLVAAARGMTTLDVRMATLRAAVSPYPVVKDLRVSTRFPHGMTIRVIEQKPVAAVMLGGGAVPVAGDGTLLHDVSVSGQLPLLSLTAAPGGLRISEPAALQRLQVLAVAPSQLLSRISDVSSDYWHGVVVQLRQGPSLYFGGPSGLRAKWDAVTAVLATPQSAGAAYIDVSDPQRPAAGAGASGSAGAIGASTSTSGG